MRIAPAWFMALAMSLPGAALAQGDGADNDEAPPPEAQPVDETVQTARDEVRRGFFVALDPGVFVTFGGRLPTTDARGRPVLVSKVMSNAQPYVGLTLGYDVVTGSLFNLGIGLKLAAGFNSGAGRHTAEEAVACESDPDACTPARPTDYAVYEVGLAAHLGFMAATRWAINVKLHGGVGFTSPHPTKLATEMGASDAAIGAAFGGCAGFEYFTLINDFSIGLDVCFEGAMAGGLIPAASSRIPIKYTF